MRQLRYNVTLGITGINIVTVFEKNRLFCELEVLADSSYHTVEEIENWLDNNGYESKEFEITRIR
jgi:hypothetical protein